MSIRAGLRRKVLQGLCAFLLIGTLVGAGGSGNVQPPSAKPRGYGLPDMTEALAYFTASGNDPDNFPDTPFQILFVEATGLFTVKTGTQLFVPLLGVTDGDPIIGDFPADASETANYFFGADQLGITVLEVEVDGRTTSLGAGYATGPVFTPGLADGGSHFLQAGAFLTPLNKGKHIVKTRVVAEGAAIVDAFGGPIGFENVYTVVVK